MTPFFSHANKPQPRAHPRVGANPAPTAVNAANDIVLSKRVAPRNRQHSGGESRGRQVLPLAPSPIDPRRPLKWSWQYEAPLTLKGRWCPLKCHSLSSLAARRQLWIAPFPPPYHVPPPPRIGDPGSALRSAMSRGKRVFRKREVDAMRPQSSDQYTKCMYP